MAQRERSAASRAGARPAKARGARAARPTEPRVDLRAVRERLRTVVIAVVTDFGLDLDDLSVTRAGQRLLVRVTVDGDDGVSHDELSEVARDLSAELDAAEERGGELTPGAYTLEVSSPGVDRPLTLPRHWRRNVGRLVTVRSGGRGITARVTAADGTGVTFEGAEPVAYADLGPGHVQVEFSRLADLADEDFGEDFTDGGLQDATDGADIGEEDEA